MSSVDWFEMAKEIVLARADLPVRDEGECPLREVSLVYLAMRMTNESHHSTEIDEHTRRTDFKDSFILSVRGPAGSTLYFEIRLA
jgi:hypothetical protein